MSNYALHYSGKCNGEMHVTLSKFVLQQDISLSYYYQNTWLYLKILYWSYAISRKVARCKSLTTIMSKQNWHWIALYYN